MSTLHCLAGMFARETCLDPCKNSLALGKRTGVLSRPAPGGIACTSAIFSPPTSHHSGLMLLSFVMAGITSSPSASTVTAVQLLSSLLLIVIFIIIFNNYSQKWR